MTDKREPKGAPIRVGEDFNDEEATLLDVSLDAVRAAVRARRPVEPPVRAAGAEKRAPPPSVADDDLEKTEMLDRPDLDDVPAPAPPRGVVPLGADAARLLGKTDRGDPNPPRTESFPALLSDEAETVMLARPQWSSDEVGARSAEPDAAQVPPVRPLDELAHTATFDDPSDDKTLSRPKIARMTFRKDQPRIDDEPDGADDDTRKRAPAESGATAKAAGPRPLPAPAPPRIRPAPTKSRPARAVGPDADDDAD